MIALPYPTALPAAPGQSDATDANGRIDETPGGAPVLHLAWPVWPPAPVWIWELIIRPTAYQRWRVWIVGNPERLFHFCIRRGWPYLAHRCDCIDPALPGLEDVGP